MQRIPRSVSTDNATHISSSRKSYRSRSKPLETTDDPTDPWLISSVQADYYFKQFQDHSASCKDQLDGQAASKLFERSQLSRTELCHVWELADTDKDGKLTLTQFMLAFHLIVARKNQFQLPMILPKRLLESARLQVKFILQNNSSNNSKNARSNDEVRQSLLEKQSKNIMLKKLNVALEKQIREVQAERMLLEHRTQIY